MLIDIKSKLTLYSVVADSAVNDSTSKKSFVFYPE